jgi:hypothetical protein
MYKVFLTLDNVGFTTGSSERNSIVIGGTAVSHKSAQSLSKEKGGPRVAHPIARQAREGMVSQVRRFARLSGKLVEVCVAGIGFRRTKLLNIKATWDRALTRTSVFFFSFCLKE